MYAGGAQEEDKQENISLKSVQLGSRKSGGYGKRLEKRLGKKLERTGEVNPGAGSIEEGKVLD